MKLKSLSGVTDLFARKQINLNSVVVVVKKKSLKVPDIKKICDYYKLCYHCKQNHFNIMAKKYLSKGTILQSGQFMETFND